MGVLKRKTGAALCSSLRVMRSTAVLISFVAIMALICACGCEQRAGLKPSAPGPEQMEVAAAARPVETAIPELTNAHCMVCHPQQPQTIETRGGKHKTDVG